MMAAVEVLHEKKQSTHRKERHWHYLLVSRRECAKEQDNEPYIVSGALLAMEGWNDIDGVSAAAAEIVGVADCFPLGTHQPPPEKKMQATFLANEMCLNANTFSRTGSKYY